MPKLKDFLTPVGELLSPVKLFEDVSVCEANAVITPPFPTSLPAGGTVELCTVFVPDDCEPNAFLLSAVVNWSVTFTGLASPLVITSPGSAQITFEILRDGIVIYRVIETASQIGANTAIVFVGPTTTFTTTSLLHLDTASLWQGCCNPFPTTYTLRATGIILTPPLSVATVAATVTAAAGAVTLVAEEVDLCKEKHHDHKKDHDDCDCKEKHNDW